MAHSLGSPTRAGHPIRIAGPASSTATLGATRDRVWCRPAPLAGVIRPAITSDSDTSPGNRRPAQQQPFGPACDGGIVARSTGDPAALLDALTRPNAALMVPELSDLRLARLTEAQALADRVDDPITTFWAAQCRGLMYAERADPDGMNQAFDQAEALSARVGHPLLRRIDHQMRCGRALIAGDLDTAEALANQMIQIHDWAAVTDNYAESVSGGHLHRVFCMRGDRGRLNEAIIIMQRVAQSERHTAQNDQEEMLLPASLAVAEVICGELDHARHLLDAAAAARFNIRKDAFWLYCVGLWAEVAAELRDQDAAAVLYQQLSPWHHLFATGGPTPLHSVAHLLGRLASVLGRVREAEQHFTEALAINRRMAAKFCTAETQLALGQLLLPHDPVRAGQLLYSATHIATQYGYGSLQRPTTNASP